MLSRAVSRFAVVSSRRYAAAASAAKASGSEELRFTLASPDQAVYNSATVKQVDVPTLAGVVGVLASHVPTIGNLKPGVVQVTESDGSISKYFVSSGSFSMNIDGTCQVLAEGLAKLDEIDESAARAELESAQRASSEGSDVAKAEAQIRAEVAEALVKAVSGH